MTRLFARRPKVENPQPATPPSIQCTAAYGIHKNLRGGSAYQKDSSTLRQLENTPDPDHLKDASRSLRGHAERGDSPRNDLMVERGQVTFDAEGNDDPVSHYFSRQLHWPGGASGVTLGRGYDMRHRTPASVCADLMQAGIDEETARKFSKGAELSGDAARDFVMVKKPAYGTISQRCQRILFETVVYPRYEIAAKQRYDLAVGPDAPTWNNLDSRVRDIAVDFTYQQGSIWKRQLPYITANDRQRLADYIDSTPELSRYEPGRKRVDYLRGKDSDEA